MKEPEQQEFSTPEFCQKLAESSEIIEFATTPARAYIIIAQLQLALRHPNNTGHSMEITRAVIANLTEAVCHFVPEARTSIELGENPAYDATPEYFDAEFT